MALRSFGRIRALFGGDMPMACISLAEAIAPQVVRLERWRNSAQKPARRGYRLSARATTSSISASMEQVWPRPPQAA
jgi:hypothetical protein